MTNCIIQGISASFDPDATTYINAVVSAGGTLTSPQQTGINRWFLDMKGTANGSYSTYNVFSRIVLAFLYTQGVSAAQDAINAVSPGTYNGTDTGSPTYNATNLTVSFNGSSQYTDTNHTPNGESITFANSDLTVMGIHRQDTNNDTNATVGEVGGGNSYMQIQGTFPAMILSGSTAVNASMTHAVNGLWSDSWADASTLNAYYNGSNIKANSTAWGNTASRSVYLGAFHGGSGPGYGGAIITDFYFEGKSAWTDNEMGMMYNAGKALKVALGGTAWL